MLDYCDTNKLDKNYTTLIMFNNHTLCKLIKVIKLDRRFFWYSCKIIYELNISSFTKAKLI